MNLKLLRAGVKISAKLGRFIVQRRGIVIYVFEPLLRKYGKEAGRFISRLESAFEIFMESGSDASFRTAWNAYAKLQKLALKLPINEQVRVGIELERRAQTLLIHQSNMIWLEHLEQPVKKTLKLSRAVKNGIQHDKEIHNVMASLKNLLKSARKNQTTLYKTWRLFTDVVSPNSPAVQSAMRDAAKYAPEVKEILRDTKLTAALRTQKLNGYMVTVRGKLGEGYALLSQMWLKEKDVLLADANRFAESLGPGYEARYVTQLEHAIVVNGARKEGPDALIVILNREDKIAILHTSAQVKTAKVSEAIEQTINDMSRSIGQEKDKLFLLGSLELRLGKNSEQFVLSAHGKLPVNRYIMTAAGGRLPAKDIKWLVELGDLVTEIVLDMSVDQFTHLAITIMEAALKVR